MCGIVGHVGSENSVNVMMSILKRLEYRGYDSSGICIKTSNQANLQLYKKTGKLDKLKNLVEPYKLKAHIGIGHTRWATHGGISDKNAHPHVHGNIALVCNGIIENANTLKNTLIKEGWEFKSETDSEVLLILIKKALKSKANIKQAITQSFRKIEGNCAVVVMDKSKNEIACIRRSAPLVLGLNSKLKDGYIASDPYALIGHVDNIFFPENETLSILKQSKKGHEVQFFDMELNPSQNFQLKKQTIDDKIINKGKFEHYMLKEIHEQPQLVLNLMNYYSKTSGQKQIEKALSLNRNRLNIVACGTAWHAGLLIKHFIESNNRIFSNVDLASEFRYKNPVLDKKELGLFISQSGETADTLSAVELCNEQGLDTLSIINTENSSIDRETNFSLPIHAGVEIGVASTKAFTLQVLTGYLFSNAIKNNSFDQEALYNDFSLLSSRIKSVLDQSENIKKVAKKIKRSKSFIFTGRGANYPIALESALKLKEIAYVHAEGFASGELKHGPLALIEDKMINIAIVGPKLYSKTLSNIEEVRARKGKILIIGPENDTSLELISDYYIPINFHGLGDLSCLVVNVATQLLSYYIAKELGTNIDKPRNLAKSVTVE